MSETRQMGRDVAGQQSAPPTVLSTTEWESPPSGGTGGQSTATAATEQAKAVGSAALGQARDFAGEARSEAGRVAERTREEVRKVADDRASQLGESLRDLARQLNMVGSGEPMTGPVVDVSHNVGRMAEDLADRLQRGGFDSAMTGMRSLAQRRPGAFLAGAAVAGFTVTRLLRDAKEATSRPSGSGGNETAPAPPYDPFATPGGTTVDPNGTRFPGLEVD